MMDQNSFISKMAILAVLVTGTVLGIAGVDLILPAIPSLPTSLGGDAASAQLVLASFAAGAGLGMLLFGRLGDRFDRVPLLTGSFTLYGLASLACAWAPSINILIGLRFCQGAAGTAAAVFAPGFIRQLLAPGQAVRALGVMGSVEAMVPALAPLVGMYLLQHIGWQSSFALIGLLSLALAVASVLLRPSFPHMAVASKAGSYWALLRQGPFMRYCLSHALVLGGLLTLVFGAPAVIVNSMHGQLWHFIAMQVAGISSFVIAANLSQRCTEKFGVERMLSLGTALALASSLAILLYAFTVNTAPWHLIPLFVPMNLGFGLRGPPGFFRAIIAARGDDARGSALVVLAIMGISALGTASVAPFIHDGLPALATVTAALMLGAALVMKILPPLPEQA